MKKHKEETIMSKTVAEVLQEISPAEKEDGTRVRGRFSKKNFNTLMKAMLNDPDFTVKVANVKKGEITDVEEIMVSKNFRKWVQKLMEEAGFDKSESIKVLDKDFVFPNVDGLYEFFAAALYEYISAGNQFDLMTTEDFKGSIYMKDVKETVVTKDAKDVRTGNYLGKFETTKKKHRELGVNSGCPDWLKSRRKVDL